MKTTKVLVSIILILHLSACTAFRPAVLPGNYTPKEIQEQDRRVVKVGSTVKVYLNCGSVITGEVVEIFSGGVVIGKIGNYGYKEFSLNESEISSFEVEGVAGALGMLRGATLIAGALVGTVIVLIWTHLPDNNYEN